MKKLDGPDMPIKAGHKIPLRCDCAADIVQHIALKDGLMSSADIFECLKCGSLTPSSEVGPVWYPPQREVL